MTSPGGELLSQRPHTDLPGDDDATDDQSSVDYVDDNEDGDD